MIITMIAIILLATVAGTIGYGRMQNRSRNMTEWAVGGRKLGTLLFWFMNAGEVYTTFAVLGISGHAWAFGAPAYLAFCSVSLSYAVGYILMPKIWRVGRIYGFITQADFIERRYDAPWLGILTGLIGIASLIVYVQIQLVSLGLIVSMTLGGSIDLTLSTFVAGGVMIAFVLIAGLRSAAIAATVKDVLMIVLVVTLVVPLADITGSTSILDIFARAEALHPGVGKLPGLDPSSPTGPIWLMTAALNIALGNWVFPHLFQVAYSAGSATSIRRNAIWQPLYSLSFALIILLGLAAQITGTQPPDGNLNAALLKFVTDKYPNWVIGLMAGTGFLLALAPGSVLLLTAGSIFSRNVLRPIVPSLSDRALLQGSRFGVVFFCVLAVWLTLAQKGSLVSILLWAYSAIGMLTPAVFLGFLWKRTTAMGILAGLIAGFAVLLLPASTAWLAANAPHWEPGLIAMAVNAVFVYGVSLMTPPLSTAVIEIGLFNEKTASVQRGT